jgi:putative transcriptional regulator
MESLSGHLLVASPFLMDPNFVRTVVLLIHHSDEGAFGVVLNRLSEKTVQELWEDVSETPCESQERLHLGGPVSGPLIAIHTDSELSEMEILPGLYFSAQREHLEKLISRPGEQLRLFVGHAGWGDGQLENEMKVGSWLTRPATIDYVFYDESELWKRVARDIGESLLLETLKVDPKVIPPDPRVN